MTAIADFVALKERAQKDKERGRKLMRKLLTVYWERGDGDEPPDFIKKAMRWSGYTAEPPADRAGWIAHVRRVLDDEAPRMTFYEPQKNVKAGDDLITDDGFTCLPAGKVRRVHEDDGGLYIKCKEGHHYLDGQDGYSADLGCDVYVGLLKVPGAKKKGAKK